MLSMFYYATELIFYAKYFIAYSVGYIYYLMLLTLYIKCKSPNLITSTFCYNSSLAVSMQLNIKRVSKTVCVSATGKV